MLGETYELVTTKYRYLNETIEHISRQTDVFCVQGEDYTLYGQNFAKSAFKMYGGRGLLEIEQDGLGDIIFHKF